MKGLLIKRISEGKWRPDPFMKLPKGARIKVLRHDEKTSTLECLIRWPDGYIEPRHTHNSQHSTFILQGRVMVEGKELRAGDYLFGRPGLPHGPFEWHDDCIVFDQTVGDPVHIYKRGGNIGLRKSKKKEK